MTRDTFQKALDMAEDNESHICIGGGEPTLHPLFQEFLMQAVWQLAHIADSNGTPSVHMVTNGSNTEIACTLAKLAARGVISCNLSQDRYHDPIDERVVRLFTKEKKDNYYRPNTSREEYDCRGINEQPHYIQKMGRARLWGNRSAEDGCCGGIFVNPKGVIYPCECRLHSIGTVTDPHSVISEHFCDGACVRSKRYKTEIVPMIEEHKAWRVAHVSVKRAEAVPA